jgi:O-antigen/teichoic acid export membrane protein
MTMIIQKFRKDGLARNSFYLILASGIASLFGAVFWMINARLFSPDDLGMAAMLIASMGLISTLTMFGFDYDIIRHWKSHERKRLVSSCHVVSFLASVAGCIIFLSVLDKTEFLRKNWIYGSLFVVLASSWSVFVLNDSVYIAMRKSKQVAIKQAIFSSLKLVFPFMLAGLGFFSIFLSWTIAGALALAFVLLYNPIDFGLAIDFGLIRKIFKSSIYNYLSNVFTRARELSMPLIVASMLGAKETGYFFIAFSVLMIFQIAPKSISKALLAELSHRNRKGRRSARKSILLVVLIGAIILATMLVAGKYLLLLYGGQYASKSLSLLWIFSAAGLIYGINEICYTVMRVESRLKRMVALQGANLLITVALCLSIGSMGINYMGIAWLASESITLLMNAFFSWTSVRWAA